MPWGHSDKLRGNFGLDTVNPVPRMPSLKETLRASATRRRTQQGAVKDAERANLEAGTPLRAARPITNLIPEPFIDHLVQRLDQFSTLDRALQVKIASLIWLSNAPSRKRKHKRFPGFASIHSADLRAYFGRSFDLREFNHRHQYFVITPGHNGPDGYTNGYAPHPVLVKPVITEYLEVFGHPPSRLIDADGRAVRATARPIAARYYANDADDKPKNNSKWIGCSPASWTPINLPALTAFRAELRAFGSQLQDKDERAKFAFLADIADEIYCLSRNDIADGHLPVRYVQGPSGRLYAEGDSLQNAPRWVRRAAMAGQFDFDLSNAHFTILDQLAAARGYQCVAIREYLKDKRSVREQLADDIGIDIPNVKECLIALIYGARTNNSAYGAISDIIGSKQKTEALFANPTFRAIAADSAAATNALIRSLPADGTTVRNAMGLARERKSLNDRQIASHLLQGVEAAALRAVVRRYGDRITLCMHDGWCSTEALDHEEMQVQIQSATGLGFAIEVARMAPPSMDEILAQVRLDLARKRRGRQ